MSEKVVRKKAVKKTTKKTATKRSASTAVRTRKAPTAIADKKADAVYTRNLLIGASVTLLVFMTVSIVVGFSDKGEIVVSQEFQKRLDEASEEEKVEIEKARSKAPTNNLPLGGLVPAGKGPAPEPAPAPQVVDVATSTDDTASSTSATEEGDEEGDNTSEQVEEINNAETADPVEGEQTEETAPS